MPELKPTMPSSTISIDGISFTTAFSVSVVVRRRDSATRSSLDVLPPITLVSQVLIAWLVDG